jgi:arylsulfatase A-like enzyme
LIAALLAALLPACSRSEPPPNVVVIVMDTARPDYLSAYGHQRPTTPFLERFAADATRYERAYSVSCWTLPAHGSLFSGEPPEVHRLTQANTRAAPDLRLLAEDLQGAGYQTAGFSANAWISKSTGLDRGFEHFSDRLHLAAQRESAGGEHPTVADLRGWLAQRDPERPAFVFVNLIEPHMPYRPPWEAAQPFLQSPDDWRAGIRDLFPPKTAATATTVRHYARQRPLDETEWRQLRGLYEGDVRQCDEIVRRLVDEVDRSLDPRRTLLFVLSDHGENLGDHDHVSHVFNLYDSNLRIALFARGPGFAPGAVERRLVQITDLHPTILRAAGLEPCAGSAALDLRRPLPDERILHASLDWPRITLTTFPEPLRADGGPLDRYKRSLVAAVSARWKLIRGSDGSVEAYDLRADPDEQRPVALDTLAGPVRTGLEAFLEVSARGAAASGAGDVPLPTDPQTLEALRALGYTQ